MGVDVDEGYTEFVEYHQIQLKSIGLPEHAWRQVYAKLQPRVVHDLEKGVTLTSEDAVVSVKDHQPYSAVFVLPHLWTGDGSQGTAASLREMLLSGEDDTSPLLQQTTKSSVVAMTTNHAADLVNITGCSIEAATATLASCNNDLIIALDTITTTNTNTDTDTKALSDALNLPAPPSILSLAEFRSALTEPAAEGRIEEMYNDYVRKKQREAGEEGGGSTTNYKWEDDGEDHCVTVTIPLPPGTRSSHITSKLVSRHWRFGLKGHPPIIDGELGGLVVPDECTWTLEKGGSQAVASLQKAETEVFLWRDLITNEERVSEGLLASERELTRRRAMEGLWRRALTYQAVTVGGKQQYTWYLPPSEISNMVHSPKPKFKLAPFWSCYGGKIVTLLWPIRSVKAGDLCTLEKVCMLYQGESDLQREARLWCMSDTTDIPHSFVEQYNNLCPPFKHNMVECREREISGSHSPSSLPPLTVATKAVFSETCLEALRDLNVTIVKEAVTDCAHWVEGKQDRGELTPSNGFDGDLTNLIRLNNKMREGGERDWWLGGYHLNTELPALLASPASWETLWVVRCAEDSAPSHVTNSATRLGRLCENSLNYFVQPFIDSFYQEGKQCTLEFTVVSTPTGKWYISDIPAIHKAREAMSEDCQYYIDQYLPRSDGGHLPSTPWAPYLLEFSVRASWPDMESQIHHIVQDLLPVEGSPTPCCYGIQFIIGVDHLKPYLVGVNSTPTYFPSATHLAAAFRLLFSPGYQPGNLYRRVH
eukprot:sb/3462344/